MAAGENVGTLLQWCANHTVGYGGVSVVDLDRSWKNGLALAALVHRFYPDRINFADLSNDDAANNFRVAQEAAESATGVAPMLCPEDWADSKSAADNSSIVVYLSALREAVELSEKSNDVERTCIVADGEKSRSSSRSPSNDSTLRATPETAAGERKRRGSALAHLQSMLSHIPQPPSPSPYQKCSTSQPSTPSPHQDFFTSPPCSSSVDHSRSPSSRNTPSPSARLPDSSSRGLSPQSSSSPSPAPSQTPDSERHQSSNSGNVSRSSSRSETPGSSEMDSNSCRTSAIPPGDGNHLCDDVDGGHPSSVPPGDNDVCDGVVGGDHPSEDKELSHVREASATAVDDLSDEQNGMDQSQPGDGHAHLIVESADVMTAEAGASTKGASNEGDARGSVCNEGNGHAELVGQSTNTLTSVSALAGDDLDNERNRHGDGCSDNGEHKKEQLPETSFSPVEQLTGGQQQPSSTNEAVQDAEDVVDTKEEELADAVPEQISADDASTVKQNLPEGVSVAEAAETKSATSQEEVVCFHSADESVTAVGSSLPLTPKPRGPRKAQQPGAPVPAPRARLSAQPRSTIVEGQASTTSLLPAVSTTSGPARIPLTPSQRTASHVTLDDCHFCGKPVFTLERLDIEGVILHRKCVRCHECGKLLHELSYDILDGRFLCTRHYRAKLRMSKKSKSSASVGLLSERPESMTVPTRAEDDAEEAEFAVGVENLQKLLENSLEKNTESATVEQHVNAPKPFVKAQSAFSLVSHQEHITAESAPKTKRKAPAPPSSPKRTDSVQSFDVVKRASHKKGRAPPPPTVKRASSFVHQLPGSSLPAARENKTNPSVQSVGATKLPSPAAQTSARRKRRAPPPPGQPKLPPAGHRRTKRRAPPVPKDFKQRQQQEFISQEPRTLADVEKQLDLLDRERQIQEEVGIQLEELIRRAEVDKQNTPYLNRLQGKWDLLLQKKQNIDEEESYLLYLRHDLELIQTKANIEADLRRLMEIDPSKKTAAQEEEEKLLLEELVDIVDERNQLLEGLQGDRVQESEEQNVTDGKAGRSKVKEATGSAKASDKTPVKDKKREKEEKERLKKEKEREKKERERAKKEEKEREKREKKEKKKK